MSLGKINFKFNITAKPEKDPHTCHTNLTVGVGMAPVYLRVSLSDEAIRNAGSKQEVESLIGGKVREAQDELSTEIINALRGDVHTKVCCPKCGKNFDPNADHNDEPLF